MPMLHTQVGEEIRLPALRPVFLRGRRLTEKTHRRLRDIYVGFLYENGCDCEDISSVTRLGCSARQIRNIVKAVGPVLDLWRAVGSMTPEYAPGDFEHAAYDNGEIIPYPGHDGTRNGNCASHE